MIVLIMNYQVFNYKTIYCNDEPNQDTDNPVGNEHVQNTKWHYDAFLNDRFSEISIKA